MSEVKNFPINFDQVSQSSQSMWLLMSLSMALMTFLAVGSWPWQRPEISRKYNRVVDIIEDDDRLLIPVSDIMTFCRLVTNICLFGIFLLNKSFRYWHWIPTWFLDAVLNFYLPRPYSNRVETWVRNILIGQHTELLCETESLSWKSNR